MKNEKWKMKNEKWKKYESEINSGKKGDLWLLEYLISSIGVSNKRQSQNVNKLNSYVSFMTKKYRIVRSLRHVTSHFTLIWFNS